MKTNYISELMSQEYFQIVFKISLAFKSDNSCSVDATLKFR